MAKLDWYIEGIAPVPIVVPSHKRAGAVTTTTAVHVDAICVPNAQLDDYAKFHPRGLLVGHPDSVIGLNAKRQWMLDYWNGRCYMLDDDISYMTRKWRPKGSVGIPTKMTQDEATELVNKTEFVAREAGAKMYAFCSVFSTTPRSYNGNRPLRFGGKTELQGYISPSKLYFPVDTSSPIDDEWISLYNAHAHRFVFRDTRFRWQGYDDGWSHPGGNAEFRPEEGGEVAEKKYRYLLKYFGSQAVRLKKAKDRDVPKNQWEYELVFPEVF